MHSTRGADKTRIGSDRIGSERNDKTPTESDRINKTWIGLCPIDKTRTRGPFLEAPGNYWAR